MCAAACGGDLPRSGTLRLQQLMQSPSRMSRDSSHTGSQALTAAPGLLPAWVVSPRARGVTGPHPTHVFRCAGSPPALLRIPETKLRTTHQACSRTAPDAAAVASAALPLTALPTPAAHAADQVTPRKASPGSVLPDRRLRLQLGDRHWRIHCPDHHPRPGPSPSPPATPPAWNRSCAP